MAQLSLPLDYDQQLPQGFTNLIIYRSSAGSGKTFTLVKDYIKLLLRDPENYRKILAITFTNKATEEMKTRILEELGAISGGEKTTMYKVIEEELNDEFAKLDQPVPPIQTRAQKSLDKILHNYGKFGISTLDHFFTRVVRGLARELNLPLKYDIDVDNERAIEFAIAEVYKNLDTDPELLSWLQDFVFSKIDDGKAWDPDSELKNLGQELFKENFRKNLGDKPVDLESFKRFVELLKSRKSGYENKLKSLSKQGLDLVREYNLYSGDFLRKGAGNVNEFYKFQRGQFPELSKTMISIANGEGSWSAKTAPKKSLIEEVANAGLNRIAEEIYHIYLAEYTSYSSANFLLRNIFAYGIMGVIDSKLELYREENNLVLLADNTFLMQKFIDNKDAPLVYEKIGSKYSHILIDEFQDTSIYQWSNLLPLVKHILYEHGRVLIVGDEKQSIYRWRGGEMRLLVEGIEEDLHHFNDQKEVLRLDTNYRSTTTIVVFNNRFFAEACNLISQNEFFPDQDKLLAETFKNVHQLQYREDEGYVEVQFFDDDRELSSSQTWMDKAKQETVEIIQNCYNQGFSPGDILILVDKWSLGELIAEHLVANDLPIISDRTLRVQNSPKVKLLLSAIKWLNNPDDLLAKTDLLFLFTKYKEIDHISDHEIFVDLRNEGQLFEELLPKAFLSNLRVFLRMPLYELVENLVVVFGIQRTTDNFVLRFLEICLEQSAFSRNDLYSFLSWWETSQKEHTVIMPETADAIRIMTIHGAKGLEKPVVIMPFAYIDLRTLNNSTFWTDEVSEEYEPFNLLPLNFSSNLLKSDFSDAYRKELLEGIVESMNKVYVAFTRAQDRLYILTQYQDNLRGPSDIGSLASLLKAVFDGGLMFADKPEAANSSRAKMAEMVYSWGTESQYETSVEEHSTEVENVEYILSVSAANRVDIRAQSNRFFMLFENEKSETLKRGLILHKLFEILQSPSTLDDDLKTLQSGGLIGSAQLEDIKQISLKLLAKPEFKNWYDGSWEAFNEREIISTNQISRPDKVLIKGKDLIIIDFKTGEEDSKHLAQIKGYGALLEWSGLSISLYLIYLDLDKIVEVQ